MTTFCRIVLTVVSCTINPATQVPTPAEAVAILRASSPPFAAAPTIEPSTWYVGEPIAYDRDWPFKGSFAPTPRADPTWALTARRLDGTSLWDPPMVYGLVPHVHRGWYGQSGSMYQGSIGRPQRSIGLDDRTVGGTRPLHAGEVTGAVRTGGHARGAYPRTVPPGRPSSGGDRGGILGARRR